MKLAAILLPLLILFVPSNSFASSNVKINEFLAHPGSGNEWVEFYNPDQVDISSYFLDDDTDFSSDSGSSSKKSLSTINVSNLTYPYLEFGSFLNNDSDYVVLFGADGSIVDQYQYTSDPGNDIPIGRSPDGSGQFSPLSSQSKGSANSNPTPTPDPTPTPSPSPSPSPTPTPSPTPASSPTPTPIKSPSPSPKPTPKNSPSPSSQTPTVLGETSETNSSPGPSASPEAESGSLSKTKAAALITGAGAILIALSFGFYLWYSKLLGKEKAEDFIEVEEAHKSIS